MNISGNMGENIKFRHEDKYICALSDLEAAHFRARSVMRQDPYADLLGSYHIRSIYFDDLYDTSYYENEAGVDLREKWRIRAYNCDSDRIVLEAKRKEHGMIQKRSCPLNRMQFEKLLLGKIPEARSDNAPLLNQFILLQRTRLLLPKVVVGYDRRPFVCGVGNVRVTFDCNIFSSPDIHSFFQAELHGARF